MTVEYHPTPVPHQEFEFLALKKKPLFLPIMLLSDTITKLSQNNTLKCAFL